MGVAEAHDEGIPANAARATDDDDQRVRVWGERLRAEKGANGSFQGMKEVGVRKERVYEREWETKRQNKKVRKNEEINFKDGFIKTVIV